MKKRILIFDDEKLFSESIANLISEFEFVESCEVRNENDLHKVKHPLAHYGLILLDVNMPGRNGFELAEAILKKNPSSKLVFLTVRQDHQSIERAKKIGAKGFIFKSIGKNQLRTSLIEIALGQNVFMEYEFSNKGNFTFSDGRQVQLTTREQEFLRYICEELGTKEIAIKMGISFNTAHGYRKILHSKFQVNNIVGLTKYALQLK